MISLLLAVALTAPAQDTHPLKRDKTGIRWALPFTGALERARAENRILLIKPVAFGTTRDGGW